MPPRAKAPPIPKERKAIVPDTSVIVDGRITLRVQRNELSHARVLIPQAVVAELEYQANQGRESGFNGLDEILKLQELKVAADLDVEFVGERPSPEDIELAASGEIDSLIRSEALEHGARLITSDRVQAHVARAMGIDVEYLRPVSEPEEVEKEIRDLAIMQFFDEHTMSVHLKQDVPPYAKRGRPGEVQYTKLGERLLERRELSRMSREIIETARRDVDSFVEIERHGATVVQLGPMRIAIARPPFSDGFEITAVRPVAKLGLDEYAIPNTLRERLKSHQRGVFVSGPPGSGKSTFVTAVAEWLAAQDVVVKTMESPRDLQVPASITQYAPLERSMELTSDVLLLVRPDFVVYDEVRKTEDFRIFADMRLAGVGLIGVTHANRAIDAVQRLIGRVELGMIPQVVDTVIHIEGGRIKQVLEMSFTVKVPAGMQEADLARPVIEVRDFATKRNEFEIYTYGEQVVVMPLSAAEGGRDQETASPLRRFAAKGLKHELRSYVRGRHEVEFTGDASITIYADEDEIPSLIGRGGSVVQGMQRELGLSIDIRPLRERRAQGEERRRAARAREPVEEWEEAAAEGAAEAADEEGENGHRRYAEVTPEVRKSKKNIVLMLDRNLAGQEVEVAVDGEAVFTATVGAKGDIRIGRRSDWGQEIADALAAGRVVTVRV